MITPYTVYFACTAVCGLCVALLPELTLGQKNKDRLQSYLDGLVESHGSGFAVFAFCFGLSVACIAWPLMVVERIVELVSTKRKE